MPQRLDAYLQEQRLELIEKPAGGTQNFLSWKSRFLPRLQFVKTLGLYV